MANTASKVVKVAEAEEGYLEKKTNGFPLKQKMLVQIIIQSMENGLV